MIPGDLLAKLPDAARTKLQLIADLAADALVDADAALTRLNAVARRQGSSDDDPGVVRLSAKYEVQSHRHQQLFSLANAIERWLRSLPPHIELEIAAAPPPPSLSDPGEAVTPEEMVMRIRAKLAELTVQRACVLRTPEPKEVLRVRLRAQVARLREHARPVLHIERGKPDLAVFRDPAADFGLREAYVVGMLAWFDPERMDAAVDGLIDDLPDSESMTEAEHVEALAELDREIEALERSEESLIVAAFERGVDVLRRSTADPQCVLGVRLPPKPVAPARARRQRLAGPAEARAAE
jgi:hypothetical protein